MSRSLWALRIERLCLHAPIVRHSCRRVVLTPRYRVARTLTVPKSARSSETHRGSDYRYLPPEFSRAPAHTLRTDNSPEPPGRPMDLCTNAAHGRLGMQTQVATAGATDPLPADTTAKRRRWPALQWAWSRSARVWSSRVLGRLFAGLPASTCLLMDLALFSGGCSASSRSY